MSNRIKLIKLAQRINIGIETLGETLKRKGVDLNINPNTKINKSEYEVIIKEHCKTMSKRELDKMNDFFWQPKSDNVNVADATKKQEVKKERETIKVEIPTEMQPKLNIKGNIKDINVVENKETKEVKVVKEAFTEKVNTDKKETVKKVEDVKPSVAKTDVVNTSDNIEPKKKDTKDKINSVQEISNVGASDSPAIKVIGKIDLSKINDSIRPAKKVKKEGKRKRIKGGAVDVKEEAAKVAENHNKNKNKNKEATNNNQNNTQAGNKKNKKKNKPVKDIKPQITEEDIQKQIKETLARLTNKKQQSGNSAKYRKDKRTAARNAAISAQEEIELESKTLKLTEFVTVSDLANMMDIQVNQIIATCMSLGLMVSINMRLEADTIEMIAEEFGFKTEFVSAEVVESISSDDEDDEADLEPRSPIVTVMGHVDHGKTSLLDRLRNTNVIGDEAGGITQHIGAYSIKLENGKRITFLDTPGHEAFTAMRARGAKMTDIAIIVVAADDDVMPQTKEAINHASAAGVPIIFAINKIDKPQANPDKIREQLAAMNYLVEEWGGKYQCQEISAKQGINIDQLLEKVLLEAEILELKANPNKKASGSIVESSLDKGRGYVATVMVQNGTLKMGDIVLSGTNYGKVKAMFNERNKKVKEAGPATPVLILGLDGAPTAGENFVVMDSEQAARSISNKREQLKREQNNRTKKGLTLDELARRKALGNFQELNVIIKGDVDGSIEALSDSLIKLSTEEIQVNVLHKGVGQISESDIVLASASSAIIIGFQVRPSQAAKKLADKEGVEIRTYSIIYDTIEDIKSAMEGMLSPEIKENITANLEILQTFKVSNVGTVAGCMVVEGKIKRTNKIRLIRDGIVKYEGELGSLKRYKDDVKEVAMGLECGLNINGYNDIKEGDMIEAYEEIEIKKTLS